MTWSPIWNVANKILIPPLAIPALSYGLFSFIVYRNLGSHPQAPLVEDLEKDKKEMESWSENLSDPNHKNFNPFSLNSK